MPIIVELLQRPGDQDLKDLACLEQEYPTLAPILARWLKAPAQHGVDECWVARFNDRILGAAWTEQRQLVAIAVRKETQGRGIATRLLTVLAADRTLTPGEELAALQWPLVQRLFVDSRGGEA